MSAINYALMTTAEQKSETNKARLQTQLAALRWRKEIEGTQITPEVRLQTDRTTRAELATIFTNFEAGLLTAPIAWKAQSGWIGLGHDMLRQALWLIHAHVQACFLAEKLVGEAIEGGEITHGDQIESAFQIRFDQARNAEIRP